MRFIVALLFVASTLSSCSSVTGFSDLGEGPGSSLPCPALPWPGLEESTRLQDA